MPKMIVDLGITWLACEAGALDDAVEDEDIPLGDILPTEERPGRVLVYVPASVSDEAAGFVYVGWLEGAWVDAPGKMLRFDCFCGLERVFTGRAGDESPTVAERPRPNARFAYISDAAFDRVMREGMRRTFRLSENIVGSIPGYAAERGWTDDKVVEEALCEYFEKHGWNLDEPRADRSQQGQN